MRGATHGGETARSALSMAGVTTFVALDGLRGVAAIAVLMAHAAALFRPVWVRSAYLAVDLFFVLSGFVLAHAYGQRLKSGLSARVFMRARLLRIMPLYLLGSAIALGDALVQQALGHGTWQGASLLRAALAACVLLPLPPGPGTPGAFAFPLNVPAWSLLFELAVNLVYGVAAPWLTWRRLGALVLASLAALAFTDWWFDGLSAGATFATLWAGVPRVMYSFFAGVLVYHFLATRPQRLHRFSPWLMFPGLLLLFYLPVPHPLRGSFDLFCAALLFPGLILYAASAKPYSAGQRRMCALLGSISFALYAVHVPLLGIAENLLSDNGVGPGWRAPFTGVAFLTVVALTSYAADRWLDRPIQRRFRSRMARPRQDRHLPPVVIVTPPTEALP